MIYTRVTMSLLCVGLHLAAERIVHDEIVVRIHSPAGKMVVTLSDTRRPALDGTPQTIADLTIDQLILADARKLQLQSTPADAHRYLEMVQRQTGQSMEAIIKSFQVQGYSYTQAIEQICQLQTQAQWYGIRINQNPRILISKDDALAYWQKATSLELRTTEITIPYKDVHTLEDIQANPDLLDDVTWSEPFLVATHELAPERASAAQAPVNAIVFTEQISQHDETPRYELTQLVGIRPGMADPFEQCYETIAQTLQQERRLQLTIESYQQLRKGAVVVFTYPADEQLFVQAIEQPVLVM